MAVLSGSMLALAAGAGLAGGAVLSKMSKQPKAPDLPSPSVERAKAETDAAQKANSKLAQRNKARAASTLLAKPIDSTSSEVTTLGAAPGKTTLGQ